MTTAQQTIQTLLKKMSAVQWSWTADAVPRLMQELGAELEVDLKDGEILAVKVVLDAFTDVDKLDSLWYEIKVDEYFQKFEDAVAAAKKVLGKPAFNDGAAVRGYPADQDALWVALWNIDNARLMVQQTHKGRKSPFRVLLVAAPPAKGRTKKR